MDADLLERCRQVAERFVSAGRVVPGLSVEGQGRARSWWWPLPSADDRALIGGLLTEDGTAWAAVAEALQELVDREARRRLVGAGVELVSARRGRRTATEAWLGSLTTHNPWLPASLPAKDVAALAAQVVDWARTGLPTVGPRGCACGSTSQRSPSIRGTSSCCCRPRTTRA